MPDYFEWEELVEETVFDLGSELYWEGAERMLEEKYPLFDFWWKG